MLCTGMGVNADVFCFVLPLPALLLQGLIEVMSSKPFYMDSSLVRMIIKRVPHVLVTIQSRVGIIKGQGYVGEGEEETEQMWWWNE